MSRKKSKQAVPDEVLAEGSGPVEVVAGEAEPAKKPSKKKFSKKKAPKGKKAATATAEADAGGEKSVDGEDSATDADELHADGDDSATGAADDDSDTDADELRVDGASPDADVLRANGDDSETEADELRADGADVDSAEADADELRVHGEGTANADALRADSDSPDADELGAQCSDPDQLRADGDGAGDDAPLVEGDDVVGEPITDEAGVEAALLPSGLSAVQLRHLIEALIFATDKPVTLQRLRQLTRVSDVARIESALAELQEDYKERGIALQQVSGGYQFRTNTVFSSWVQQLIAGRPVRLSRAQLETLAIVAYRQPITRPEIDEIRGVDSSNTLRLLLERSLIRVLGRREEVGRPTLYGTTKEFLDFFSLGDLRELPTLREYSELTAESRQVMSDRLGVPLDANGELEPEVSDELDPDQLEPDSTSIVDSILAEHAAAEAEAEARFDARDASAIAEAAMSGGSSFGHVPDDDDAMSLSGGEMATIGSRLPASEARSYVDAIRASVSVVETDDETDDVELAAFSAADALMSESREPHMADASDEDSIAIGETTSAKSNLDDESLEAHVDHDDSDSTSVSSSMNPHVETDESMSASDEVSVSDQLMSESREPHMADASGEGSMVIGETTSAKSNVDDESLEAHVGQDDSESRSMSPHVETDESMSASDEPMTADESHDAHVGHVDSESMSAASSRDPHVESDEAQGHDDSESMAATSPDVGHDAPSTGDSMAASASDAPQAGHDASRLGHEMNSAEPDLDAEAHVGHNAPVNREPDNDPESSGN